MPRWIFECVYRAFNMGQSWYRPSAGKFQGMPAYGVPPSPHHVYDSQHGTPSGSGNAHRTHSYTPAQFEEHQAAAYEPEDYDVFGPPHSQEPLRVPQRHIRDHEIALMQERLGELHEQLEELGFSTDCDLDDVPWHLREDVREILSERREIACDLARFAIDIVEVEKDLQESRTPHDLDGSAVLMGEDGTLEALDTSLLDEDASMQYGANFCDQYGSPEGAEVQDSFQDAPSDGQQIEEAQAVDGDPQPSGEQGTVALDDLWESGMRGYGAEMDTPLSQDATQLEEQQQTLEQEVMQQEELELEERLQPGPFDLPGGLEGLL